MIRLILVFVFALAVLSCSKTAEPLSSVSHQTGWLDPASDVFHADKVAVSGAVSCRACHGQDADKGTEGSFCVDCHKNYPDVSYPHPETWVSFQTTSSHASFIKAHENNLTCNKCHNGSNPHAPACSSCH